MEERIEQLRVLYGKYPAKRAIIIRQIRSLEISLGKSLIKGYDKLKKDLKEELDKNGENEKIGIE